MYYTLTSVQSGEAIPLQQYIDNRAGNLCVGLRSFTWWVGWWNWEGGEIIQWRESNGAPTIVELPPGLYTEADITGKISSANLQLNVGKHDGIVRLTVPAGREVLLSDPLRRLYGLDDEGWLDAGLYNGDRPIDFLPSKTIGLRLHQLNTTANVVDGAPSSILTYLEAPCTKFGNAWSKQFPKPEMKHLQGGTIDELRIELVDVSGKKIDNHNLSVMVGLEIY